jgi:hypothetical protein
MSDQIQIDVRIKSQKAEDVEKIERSLGQIKSQKQEQHRDWGTILTIIGDSLSIAAGLIELWKAVHSNPDMPHVEVENKSGATLDLKAAKSEAEVKKFVGGH